MGLCEYIVENGVLKKYIGEGGEAVIPEEVTSIGKYAFKYGGRITSVVIPNGVTSIGCRAFKDCGIASVVLPESVTKIGAEAFSGCNSLTSVVLPESVKSIGAGAFACCKNLTDFVLPENTKSIAERTFDCCNALTNIVLPESVKKIAEEAFAGCRSLTSIVLPEQVKTIGRGAFSCCQSLTSIVIPDCVTTIDEKAFNYCHSLNHIFLSETVMDSIDAKWFHSRFFDVDVNFVWLEGNTNFDARVGEICKRSILRKKDEYVEKIIQKDSAQAMANILPLLTKVPIDILDHYLAESMGKKANAVTAVLLDYKSKHFTTEDVEQAAEEKLDKALGFRAYTVSDWRKIFKFSIADGKAKIIAYKGTEKCVTIPAKIGKNTVTSFCLCEPKNLCEIHNQAACEQVTDVVIEDGIEIDTCKSH